MTTIKQLTKALKQLTYEPDSTSALADANKTLADALEGVETVPTVRVRLTGTTERFHPVYGTKAIMDAAQGYIGLSKAVELRKLAQEGEPTCRFAVQVKDLNLLMEHFTLLISP